jgi:uncharacterized protein with HEPN domain
MAEELTRRAALSLVKLAETLDQVTQLVTLGRERVEKDPFLPLAAEQLGIRLGHDVAALPDGWRAGHPRIPWHSVRGLRNRLARDYHEIDFDILWDAYETAVPDMRSELAADFEAARTLLDPSVDEPRP